VVGGIALLPEPAPKESHVTAQRLVNQASAEQAKATSDAFGIRFLQPTRPQGTYWISRWGAPREFTGVDPQDPWFDADHGSGSFSAGGGRLRISGETPRMYVHDPALQRQWRDVEVTVYFQRVADSGIPFAGMTAVVRANHLSTEDGGADSCDTRGYGGRFRFDGHADFEKETAHPRNEATANRTLFPEGMPAGVWLGYKFVVFDADDGVHLQLWLDTTDGRHGGDWQLVDAMVDDGHRFGSVPCAPGIDPQLALTNAPDRAGSESGRPNASVYFRSDGIADGGLVYKWASIREIAPRADGASTDR
jgi:hypothetical protein